MGFNFKITIGTRLTIGFGILIVLFLSFSAVTFQRLHESKQKTSEITEVYMPSEAKLNELFVNIANSKMLLKNWVYIDQKDDAPDKIKLKELIETKTPQLFEELNVLKESWSEEEQALFRDVRVMVEDSLFGKYGEVMSQLSNWEAYQDPMVAFTIYPLFDNDENNKGQITTLSNKTIYQLSLLKERLSKKVSDNTDEMNAFFDALQNFNILLALIIVLLAGVTAVFTVRSLVIPIKFVRKELEIMSKGIITEAGTHKRTDEIGEMLDALNELKKGFSKTKNFAFELGDGNFQAEYHALSDEDQLGAALIALRESLSKSKHEAEERRHFDEQRNWATQGIAQFAEIIRQDGSDMETLSHRVLRYIISYVGMNQGGLFITNEIGEHVELGLSSSYAYNREKKISRTILPGEGLVGMCFLERKTIFIKQVPEDYITIRSGLGDAAPRCLLIVPLKMNDKIMGILELASFEVLEQYKIEFVEKIADSIAATIANMRVNNETSILLTHSKEQAEEMRAQEEEMRQNLEELQATQEEFHRNKHELDQALQNARSEIKYLQECIKKNTN